MRNSVVTHILTTATAPQFDALYEIYCESIPNREQKSKVELSAMVSSPGYRVLISQEHDTVVAFSVTFVAEKGNFSLLEYMAVDWRWRGREIGSELFRKSVKTIYRERAPMPILIEVDSDRRSSGDDEEPRRRQNFYRKLGCRRIANCAYHLPLPGNTPAPGMDLFIYLPEPAPVIGRAKLRQWLETIYRDVYAGSADDPRIARMLETVADPIELI